VTPSQDKVGGGVNNAGFTPIGGKQTSHFCGLRWEPRVFLVSLFGWGASGARDGVFESVNSQCLVPPGRWRGRRVSKSRPNGGKMESLHLKNGGIMRI